MIYEILRFAHLAGVLLMAGGLLGVFVCDLRGRLAPDIPRAAEAAALVALFYDALVVPGALLLLAAGGALIATVWGLEALYQPWLAAMAGLFALEFVEGNTITRLAFLRLKRLSRSGGAPLRQARQSRLAVFTHFLDLPILLVIVGLGVFRPMEWGPVIAGVAAAVVVAAVLTLTVPRLLPWRS